MNAHDRMRAFFNVDTTTRRAVPPGTLPPGTKVRKTRSDPDDAHAVGALAITIGFPMGPLDVDGVELYGYFVEWDDLPFVPVFIRGDAIEPVDKAPTS